VLDLLKSCLAQQAPETESEAGIAAVIAPVQHGHLEEQRYGFGARAAKPVAALLRLARSDDSTCLQRSEGKLQRGEGP
jgi:hypothetical protein